MVPYSSFMRFEKRLRAERGRPGTTCTARRPSAASLRADTPVAMPSPPFRRWREKQLPRGYDIAWEGCPYDEAQQGNEGPNHLPGGAVFVYLVLAAQCKASCCRWPCCSPAGGCAGFLPHAEGHGPGQRRVRADRHHHAHRSAGQNAVLMVEFAVQKQRAGATILEATHRRCQARFRPSS